MNATIEIGFTTKEPNEVLKVYRKRKVTKKELLKLLPDVIYITSLSLNEESVIEPKTFTGVDIKKL